VGRADGSQVHVEAPSYAALCGGSTGGLALGSSSCAGDCGYQSLRLVYEPEPLAAAGRALQGQEGTSLRAAPNLASPFLRLQTHSYVSWQWIADWLSDDGSAAVWDATRLQALLFDPGVPIPALQCPPWCPALLPDSAIPLAVRDPLDPSPEAWMGTLQPAPPQSDPSLGQLLIPGALALPAAAGSRVSGALFYAEQCVGYTDFTTGACTNTSSPEFANCAFGAGEACRRCPADAICPGGFRAVPASAGFWTLAEASGESTPCMPPATERCMGWDASISAVRCGVGYRQHSPGFTQLQRRVQPRRTSATPATAQVAALSAVESGGTHCPPLLQRATRHPLLVTRMPLMLLQPPTMLQAPASAAPTVSHPASAHVWRQSSSPSKGRGSSCRRRQA